MLQEYRNSGTDIDKVLNAISVRENSGKWFCKQVAERIAANDTVEGGGLDQLIINRERRVKGSRRKIGNPAYTYDKKNRIHFYKLTYRWETVKVFAEELRKEACNGWSFMEWHCLYRGDAKRRLCGGLCSLHHL